MGGYSCTCLALGVHLPALPSSCVCLSTQNHIYFAPSPPVHAAMLPDTQVMLLEFWGGKPKKQSSRPAACQKSWDCFVLVVCLFCISLQKHAKAAKSTSPHLAAWWGGPGAPQGKTSSQRRSRRAPSEWPQHPRLRCKTPWWFYFIFLFRVQPEKPSLISVPASDEIKFLGSSLCQAPFPKGWRAHAGLCRHILGSWGKSRQHRALMSTPLYSRTSICRTSPDVSPQSRNFSSKARNKAASGKV